MAISPWFSSIKVFGVPSSLSVTGAHFNWPFTGIYLNFFAD